LGETLLEWTSATGDFDGDGNLDLVAANKNDQTVSILLGDGAGSFGAATAYASGGSGVHVAVGDFNEDGDPDVVTANSDGNVSILLGDGT
jgi:hypothetical protein